jgi:hypothetical protein
MAVAADHAERAGRILDVLVRLLEEHGATIELGEWSVVVITGERFRFRLKQETTRSDHHPTSAERRELQQHPIFNNVRKWDWHHTDKLTLELFDDVRYTYNPVARLRDGKRGRIEDKLAALPEILRRLVEQRQAQRAESERRRLAYEEQRRLEEEQRARAEEERRRVAALVQEAKQWREASLIHEYAVALESAVRAAGVSEDGPEMKRVRWAQQVASTMDPITRLGGAMSS